METTMAELRPGSSGAELIGRGLENVRKLLPLAAEMGLAVLAGTDLAIPVSAVSSEVAALVRSGLPPRAAVDGASTGGAAAAGLDMAFVVGRPADLVLMHDRLENFLAAFRLSQRARRIIRQNLIISLGTVVVLVTFAMIGKIPLTIGVVGHEGSTVIVVMNSLRLLFGGVTGKKS
jgi:Cd2+/Zn2+-exporting ATPase